MIFTIGTHALKAKVDMVAIAAYTALCSIVVLVILRECVYELLEIFEMCVDVSRSTVGGVYMIILTILGIASIGVVIAK